MEAAALCCPQCGSNQVYKDGLRYTGQGPIQRFLCKKCGFRFSEPGKSYKQCQTKQETIQICAFLQEAKNLDTATETKTVAGDRKPLDEPSAKGLILQFILWLQKQGYANPEEHRYINCLQMLINSGTDLYNPEHVKEIIAKKHWKNGTKMQVSYAYDALTKMLKIPWDMPTYRQEECLPFIPDEKELDSLILSARSNKLASYLQCLKETMADPTEALRIEWTEINGNVITINHPVKNHSPRPIQVSNRLIAMLNTLPKTSDRIFDTTYRNIAISFRQLRKKTMHTQQNPRISKISLVTFRHWGATKLYAVTKDILLVKKLLGHKRIENTLKYTQLIQFKDDEYEVCATDDLEEAKKFLALGFDYITETKGIMLLRKPKRFMTA